MPNAKTTEKAKQDLKEGKSASTAAGEFIREEIHHIREGKHGARNTKQAIAIGLSEARRAGIPVTPGPTASESTRKKAAQESARAGKKPNPKRVRASTKALKKEPRAAASPTALSRHAKSSAERRRKGRGHGVSAGELATSTSPRAVAKRAVQTRKRRTKRPSTRAAAA